ncbi:MAG: transglutaminase family protein [Pseudomonadota bacterium]
MRLMIQHETRYDYDVTPSSVIEMLRLTPSNSDSQSVRDWRISVSGDVALQRYEDAFGNITHTFTSAVGGEGLIISATGTVETSATSGVISGGRERLPVGVYLRETDFTEATADLKALSDEARAACDGTALDLAHRLNVLINRHMAFEPNTTHTNTTADEAWQAKSGVCQDLTHILLAAARACGLPARYVAGYQYNGGHARDAHAGHAWAEIYIDNLGWVGFDPTAGGSIDESYVRVSIGLDYLSAAPVRGSTFGGSGEGLHVNVTMEEPGGYLRPLGGLSPMSQSQLRQEL